MDPTVLAALAGLLGAIGVKVIEAVSKRGSEGLQDAAEIRRELRTEVRELRAENSVLRAQIAKLQEELLAVTGQYQALVLDMKELRSKLPAYESA